MTTTPVPRPDSSSPAGPSAGATLLKSTSTAAAVPAAPVPAWLRGSHGAVPTVNLDTAAMPSVRAIALSRRSLGLGPMSSLVELPERQGNRPVPSRANGAHPVGRTDAAGPDAAGPAPSTEPGGEPWSEEEDLGDYIDRKLLQARVLYLPNRGWGYAAAKRLLDLAGALVLLVLAAPVLLALTLLIRLDSPGPAVFHQQRVTRGGRLFTFYKFRTMWVDAADRFPELYDYAHLAARGDVYYKLADDPRSTRVGRWLRRSTLDELPNLVNVLRGDMSLVGPRPELPGLVPLYRPEDLALFFTKAGVTGLAQVAGRSLLTVRERIALDLRYVANQTLLLDVRIVLSTAVAVVLRRGAF